MKKSNLKKSYEIKEMRKSELEDIMKNDESLQLFQFEDSMDEYMIRKGKKSLYIIHLIPEESEKKSDRRSLDRDIKIESRKLDGFGIKLIYHRKKDNEKEYRIFLSWKDESGSLKRKRMRNDKIDKIKLNESEMIEYYRKIDINLIKKSIG